jgi:hypothetical protein
MDAGIIVQKVAGLAPQQARDPVSGRLISALMAAALYIKPRNQLTDQATRQLCIRNTHTQWGGDGA